MKPERFLPLALLPCAAHAGGGGGAILGVIIFLPLMIWAFIKIWSFWFRLIFGGRKDLNPHKTPSPYPGRTVMQPDMGSELKICPYCAEPIQSRAIKCKHCGSDLNDQRGGAN